LAFEQFEPEETAISLPVADIVLNNESGGVTTSYRFPVKQPDEDRNDFIVEIRASKLKKVRDKLEILSNEKFPLHEVLLGIATSSLGAFLGGLASDIPLTTIIGKIFYVGCPVIFAGTGVAYFFVRYINLTLPKIVARGLLEEIVDPDKTSGKEIKNEY